jgi:hypothetical protein
MAPFPSPMFERNGDYILQIDFKSKGSIQTLAALKLML